MATSQIQQPHQKKVSITLMAVILALVVLLAVGLYIKDRPSKHIETQKVVSQNPPSSSVSMVKERGIYAYKFANSSSNSSGPYQDLFDQGYITSSFLNSSKTAKYDVLGCAQVKPASNEFANPTVAGNSADMVVAANYPDTGKNLTLQTHWVYAQGSWRINSVTCPTT